MRKFSNNKDAVISAIVVTAIVVLIACYMLVQPMARSYAHKILNERGTVTTSEDNLYYYMEQNPTTLELKALTCMSEDYKVHLIILEYPLDYGD